MDWHALTEPAAVIGGFATGLAAGLAIASLLFVYLQTLSSRATARESAALVAWQDYLKLCFSSPEYSSTEMALRMLPSKSVVDISKQLSIESERYLWFISILLNACELVLLNVKKSADWRCTMVDQIGYHAELVKEIWPRWSRHYDAKMNALVAEGIGENA